MKAEAEILTAHLRAVQRSHKLRNEVIQHRLAVAEHSQKSDDIQARIRALLNKGK